MTHRCLLCNTYIASDRIYCNSCGGSGNRERDPGYDSNSAEEEFNEEEI